jgi:ribonuclease HII
MNSEQRAVARMARIHQLLEIEDDLHNQGIDLIAGVDEAGRGPLAGPVVAAAVIFPRGISLEGVDDSKKLTPARRESIYSAIMKEAQCVGVGIVDHNVIDAINIANATYKAMHEALSQLGLTPDHVLVDGNRFVGGSLPFTTIVDGDAKCFSIAAASIIAKVTRDRLMLDYDVMYPGYGFARHKGYGTKAHYEALALLGCCPIHRKSFLRGAEVGGEGARTGKE